MKWKIGMGLPNKTMKHCYRALEAAHVNRFDKIKFMSVKQTA